jgi:hypothetical protein
MRKILVLFLGVLAFAPVASAQAQPESAHTSLYFPHFVDGRHPADPTQQWQTTFTFVNMGLSPATVNLSLYNNSGGPLSLDFGSGASSFYSFTVPPEGIRILKSRVASSGMNEGWAFAGCSIPVQATVAFRMIANGVPEQEITAQPTLPTFDYSSAANRFLGVALANPYSADYISAQLSVYGSEGQLIGGPVNVTVPPFGHTSFNLWQKFPHLQNNNFDGVLVIRGASPPTDKFVAWTLNADTSGIMSALPPGRYVWPVSHWDRIWMVYLSVLDVARKFEPIVFSSTVSLDILYDQQVNAYARYGSRVGVTLGLSELISDSPSELAFVVGHELGHIYSQRTGLLVFYPSNREFDADIWGALLALGAGFDPYGGAGALAKLAMATGRAGLSTQFEDEAAADQHKSMSTRVDTIYDALVQACLYPSVSATCQDYKRIMHPHLPWTAPLAVDSPVR